MEFLRSNSFAIWPERAGRALCSAALALLVCVAWPVTLLAQSGHAEYDVKAAFLFSFTKFVEWPGSAFADARAPVVMGIIGEDPFSGGLSRIVDGQVVQGRGIIVRRHQFGDDLRSCQVLFVSASERARVPQILASLQGSGVLTVSDLDGFAAAGGVMQFVMEESRVRFLINLDAALQAKLRINSKLLALAHVVNRADVRGTN